MREVNTHKIIRIFLASSINIFFSSCFRLLFPYTAAIGARFCKVKEIFIFFL